MLNSRRDREQVSRVTCVGELADARGRPRYLARGAVRRLRQQVAGGERGEGRRAGTYCMRHILHRPLLLNNTGRWRMLELGCGGSCLRDAGQIPLPLAK